MKSRPRDLGTKHETRIVRAAQDAGLVAERIPEGGAADLGDVRIWAEDEWVVEAKTVMALNIHEALEKALRKSGTPHTVVWWRRMGRKQGQERRSQVGTPIVAMTPDMFLELVKRTTR